METCWNNIKLDAESFIRIIPQLLDRCGRYIKIGFVPDGTPYIVERLAIKEKEYWLFTAPVGLSPAYMVDCALDISKYKKDIFEWINDNWYRENTENEVWIYQTVQESCAAKPAPAAADSENKLDKQHEITRENLEKLYRALLVFLMNNQGNKGYIETQDETKDAIYGYDLEPEQDIWREVYVHAVRYNPNNDDVEVCVDWDTKKAERTVYKEEDFQNEENWQSLMYEQIDMAPTLLNIAENIRQYVDLPEDNTDKACEVSYGRDDLLSVAEAMASEFGNDDIAETLCEAMASAACTLLKTIRRK